MSRARRVAASVGLLGLAEVVSRIFPLLTLHHAEKMLGVRNFGYANVGLTIIDLTLPFIAFGYTTYGAMAVAGHDRDPSATGRSVAAIVSMRMLHALLAFAAMMFAVHAIPSYQDYQSIALSLSFLLFLCVFDLEFLLTGTQRVAALSWLMLLPKTVGLVAILLLVRSPEDTILYASVVCGVNAAISLLSFAANARRFTWQWPRLEDMRAVFVGSLPFALSSLILWISDRMDPLLVEATLGVTAVGLYAGPYRLMQSVTPLFTSLGRVFFAEMLRSASRPDLTRLVRLEVFLFIGLLAPMAAGAYFTGGGLLSFILSDNYRDLGPLLALFLSAGIAVTWSTIFGYQVLWTQRLTAVVNASAMAALVAGILLAVQLAKVFGLYGIALGLLLAKAASAAYLTIKARPFVESLPLRELGQVGVATLGMSATLGAWSFGAWYLDVAFGGAVYAALLGIMSRATLREILRQLQHRSPGS